MFYCCDLRNVENVEKKFFNSFLFKTDYQLVYVRMLCLHTCFGYLLPRTVALEDKDVRALIHCGLCIDFHPVQMTSAKLEKLESLRGFIKSERFVYVHTYVLTI